MNRFFTSIATSLIFIGSTFGAFAQETNSLLWKISGKDLAKPSYLFGTIHMLPEDKYFFTPKMEEALGASEVLALEADIDIPMAQQIEMAKEMIMPEGKAWSEYMSADDYSLVRSGFIDSLGIKEKKFEKYAKIRPIYASGVILAEVIGKFKVYEQELSEMAKKAKKPIIGLETIQEQMAIVSSIPVEEQMEDLKEIGGMLREYNLLVDAYLNQSLEELDALARNQVAFSNIEAKLLTERNDKWIGSIETQAAKNATFFAVGAMHLVGDNGLIKQLQTAGYSVQPIL